MWNTFPIAYTWVFNEKKGTCKVLVCILCNLKCLGEFFFLICLDGAKHRKFAYLSMYTVAQKKIKPLEGYYEKEKSQIIHLKFDWPKLQCL